MEGVHTLVKDYTLLLDAADVDVVYVAVRHDLHEQIYLDSIRAGKDLLAEKPFGIDLDAARRIVAEAEQRPGVFVRVSSGMPFFPGAQAAINFVRAGSVDSVIEVHSAFLHSSDLDLVAAGHGNGRCGRLLDPSPETPVVPHHRAASRSRPADRS